MLIWVASYPRSGSNLTLLTLSRVFGLKTGLSARPDETRRRFGIAPESDLLPALARLEAAAFLKTHGLPETGDQSAVLYLVRDGRDALVSHAHYVMGRGKPAFEGVDFESALERIIRHGHAVKWHQGQVPPDVTWSDHVRFWTNRSAPTAVLRFERLIEDPAAVIGRALESLELDVPTLRKELPSFEELRERDPVMFRRGKAGAWREEMPPALEKLFWELHGSQMVALGYPRA